MRTTLTLEEQIARDLKRIARTSGKPFKIVVNETLQAGLAASQAPKKPRRYRLRTVSLGGVREGIDLDKALGVADLLEDEELGRKMDLRK
jgi:predicted DNA-binding ribbon-helix-helix protein